MTKRIELIELNLKNFKGIEQYNLKTDGNDMDVFGDNGTGKTTLFDAFIWLLFGKDSQNKSDFEIKTLNDKGNVKQHGIDHEVEGIFRINDNELSLKRVFKEKWKKQRGSSQKTFSGHSTEYEIDGVPAKKKEYDEKVNSIISEDVFKLLTNPLYFNEKLNWKDRRQILLEIAGDITTEDILKQSNNNDLEQLISELKGRSVEDYQKVIKAKQKEINEEIERIPVRIDEINLSLAGLEDIDEEQLSRSKAEKEKKIQSKRQEIEDIKNGSEVNRKRQALSEVELEIVQIKNEHEQEGKQELYSVQARIQENTSNINLLKSKIENIVEQQRFNEDQIEKLDQEVDRLRNKWAEINETSFEHDDDTVCSTCGQELPNEQIETARQKAQEQFNEDKAKRLESIVNEANSKKEKITALEEKNEKLEDKAIEIAKEIERQKRKTKELEQQEKTLKEKVSDIENDLVYQSKLNEKSVIEEEIKQIQSASRLTIDIIQKEIEQLENELSEINSKLSQVGMIAKYQQRIDELEQKEKELSNEYERLEHELYLTEEFIKTKVDLMEEKINSKFHYARFKLFEEQLNGGIKETCETTYNGIPYNHGLNNAARINVGLDIISTLNEHYGVSAPIFIDNSESVTRLIGIESQVIRLVVSEKHQTLEYQATEKSTKTA